MGKVRIPGRHATTNGSENSANHAAPQVGSITAVAISIFTCGAAWLALFSLPFVVTCRPGILTLPIGKWLVYCKIFGKDAECVIRKWLLSNIIYPFNCTLAYLSNIRRLPPNSGVCRPDIIADNYYNNVQLVWNSANVNEECIPGCHRWDYQTALQQSQTLVPFSDYTFNLEASFNDLQYEYVREVYTTSVPGFMSQIGGQFGFFLGLSIITLLQMILYALHFLLSALADRVKRIYQLTTSFISAGGTADRDQPASPVAQDGVAVIALELLESSVTKVSNIQNGAQCMNHSSRVSNEMNSSISSE